MNGLPIWTIATVIWLVSCDSKNGERPPAASAETQSNASVTVDTMAAQERGAQRIDVGCGNPTVACFAVVLGDGANPFLGTYEGGLFTERYPNWRDDGAFDQVMALVKRFPQAARLPAYSRAGRKYDVIIEGVDPPEGDLFHTIFRTRLSSTTDETLLLSTPNIEIEILPARAVDLPRAVREKLLRATDDLFKKALNDRPADERGFPFAAEAPVAHQTSVTGNIVVRVPIKINYGARLDDRGAAYFVIAPDERIIYQTFGHPEWSPDSEQVRAADPILYFRIKPDSTVYFLADYSSAWEDNSYAIFDLSRGRPVIRSF